MPNLEKFFLKLSEKISRIVGSPVWFFFSVMLILIWLPTGFFFNFDEIWHLLINTLTTIFTFLMMSLLHASQSRWEKEIEKIQLKQERTLKLLEKDTRKMSEVIKTKVNNTEEIKDEVAVNSDYKITSLF